jgi:hypothetical protein
MEVQWDVLLPPKYRHALVLGKLPNLGYAFREYDLHDIQDLERMSANWYLYHPILVKGIIIASNGLGDHLALLLKPDSTYELDSKIYKLEHEIGEVIPSIDLENKINE